MLSFTSGHRACVQLLKSVHTSKIDRICAEKVFQNNSSLALMWSTHIASFWVSLKLGLQTSVMQRRIWQGDSKLPPLWKGTACFGANSKEGTFARICLESCTWLLLDPPQTLVPPHDVSSNRPKNILQQMHRSTEWKQMSKLHDWSHFQNIAKGTTDPRVEFCLSK